jgi:hypothetical protein
MGGEYLHVPCTFAHGLVLNCKFLDQGRNAECNEVWVVDFGTQYGV